MADKVTKADYGVFLKVLREIVVASQDYNNLLMDLEGEYGKNIYDENSVSMNDVDAGSLSFYTSEDTIMQAEDPYSALSPEILWNRKKVLSDNKKYLMKEYDPLSKTEADNRERDLKTLARLKAKYEA